MLSDDDVRRAQEAIGTQEAGDYVIQPTRHAALYAVDAPELAAALRSQRAATAAAEYERYDRMSAEAQLEFKRAAGRANLAVLLTASLGAVVLLVALIQIKAFEGLAVGIGVAGVVAGAAGAYYTHLLQQRKLLARWMNARAKAETQRHEYFAAVTGWEPAQDSSASFYLGLLQLEYFRRYELEVEVTFYTSKQEHHRRTADRTAALGGIAVSLGALATGVGGILAGSLGSDWAALAALGIIAAALAAFASTREAINQDTRNAERYERTREALQDLVVRLDEVRAAVAAGNRDALDEYVAAVQEHLSVEHRQWLSAGESMQAGVARLDAALSSGKSAVDN